MYKTNENINDTIPTCRNDNLQDGYNESLLKKTELTLKENKVVMKALNLNEIKLSISITAYRSYLFVNTNAYAFISLGTIPSNSNSTLIGWELVKFF